MSRLVLCILLISLDALAQNQSSDALAISLAQQSLVAMTGGAVIGDAVLNANITTIFGSDTNSGTAVFRAKGFGESRIDFSYSGQTRSDVRNDSVGSWQENGGGPQPYAGHNCRTDAVWFLPVLSSLAQTQNPQFVFKYVGQEQHGSANTQHIRVFQLFPQDASGVLQRLSTMDFYLEVNSDLPLSVAFNSHPDTDLNTDITTEVWFANYQTFSGTRIPFHFQKTINNNVVLDATVTSVALNTGLADTLFNLQ